MKSSILFFFFLSWSFVLFSQLPNRIDLRPHAPFAGQQGNTLSCTGWAVGYGAMTIEMAIKNRWTNRQMITQRAYSAAFIYQQINGGDCQNGATLSAALQVVQQRGNIAFNPFDSTIKSCHQQPKAADFSAAQNQRIRGVQTLFSKQKTQINKVVATQQMLAKGKPVIVSLRVTEGFYQLRKGAKFWWANQGNQTPAGSHALVVVGYDQQKQAFCLLNSQGTQWGEGGFVWLKYDYFAKLCQEAYVIF